MTYREQFDSAMERETPEQAQHWLADEIARYGRECGRDRDEAKKMILVNLGYMAGYYDDATAKKVKRLFGADHPIFGSDSYHTDTTPEQAFELGKKFAGRQP